MNIYTNKQHTQLFSGGLTFSHKLKVKRLNLRAIEDKLANKGVLTDFNNNKFFAFMVDNAISICEKLDLKLPPKITLYDFTQNDKALGYTYLYNMTEQGRRMQRFGCDFNNNVFKESPDFIDEFCNFRLGNHGSNHFLNIIFHECIHSDFFKRIQHKYNKSGQSVGDIVNTYKKIDLTPFKEEIENKIGKYATTDIFELHAVYWAKKICDSLGEDLHPKYNPFNTKESQLSQNLKTLIHLFSCLKFDRAEQFAMDVFLGKPM